MQIDVIWRCQILTSSDLRQAHCQASSREALKGRAGPTCTPGHLPTKGFYSGTPLEGRCPSPLTQDERGAERAYKMDWLRYWFKRASWQYTVPPPIYFHKVHLSLNWIVFDLKAGVSPPPHPTSKETESHLDTAAQRQPGGCYLLKRAFVLPRGRQGLRCERNFWSSCLNTLCVNQRSLKSIIITKYIPAL